MASAVQKIKLSPSRDIPFNKLVLSQANVRRVKAGISIEELAEVIDMEHIAEHLYTKGQPSGLTAAFLQFMVGPQVQGTIIPKDSYGPISQ